MDGGARPARVSVQAEDFDIGAEIERLTAGAEDAGAVVSFTGLVRGGTGAGAIEAMELEHYPAMTERALDEIVAEAERRWPLSAVRVIHRHGRLAPRARIVLVLTAISGTDYFAKAMPHLRRQEGS